MSPLAALIFLHYFFYLTSSTDVTYVNNRHLLSFLPVPPQPELNKSSVDAVQDTEKKDNEISISLKDSNAKIPEPENKVPIQGSDDKGSNPENKPAKLNSPKTTTTAKPRNDSKNEDHKIVKTTEMESGALLRGVAVVVVLTMIVIIYLGLKTYCGRRSKNPVMVSKYGVRTRRSDIEMTPLPLDEDEEDETLFEVNNPR